jgi:hypothetical protein
MDNVDRLGIGGIPGEADPIQKAIVAFLVDAPLYKTVPLPISQEALKMRVEYLVGPRVVRRECVPCGTVLNWVAEEWVAEFGKMTVAWFSCRNCGAMFGVWFLASTQGGQLSLTKYGQHPPPERNPSKALAAALGEDYTDFWRSGMTLRNNGYGIGALIYFRRIVEGMTNDLLEGLAVAMEAGNDPAAEVARVRALKEAKVSFDKKMESAAKMLPGHLRPGNVNPVQAMFDVVSESLHNHTDAECCDLVDALAEAMTLLLAKLNTYIEETKALKEAAHKVERLRHP